MYDDVNFQWYSGLIQGIFVGTCTFVGGITYGQVGIIIGGIIAGQISTYIGYAIVILKQVIQQLNFSLIQNMCTLLWEGIKKLLNRNIHLAELLEIFNQSSVRLHFLEIITNILKSNHDDRIRQIEV
ncbi:uncharacterized protein LOC112692725 isoform X2 [Sipha flava]|nr:uncharacterized protein LOC112692725 isoform X2 [Sipha flava]